MPFKNKRAMITSKLAQRKSLPIDVLVDVKPVSSVRLAWFRDNNLMEIADLLLILGFEGF